MSTNPASPYSATLFNFPIYRHLISEFLPISDSVRTLPTLNKAHRDFFNTHGVWIKHISIQNQFLPHLFGSKEGRSLCWFDRAPNLSRFPRLTSLDLHFRSAIDTLGELTDHPACGTLRKLKISGLSTDRDDYSRIITSVLERTTKLAELVIQSESTPNWHSNSGDMNFSSKVRGNLKGLTKLDFEGPSIRGLTPLQILQCSTQFVSIRLFKNPVTDAIFTEMAKSAESLKHLHLDRGADADYRILNGCTRLERFTPPKALGANDLISMISTHSNITELSLRDASQFHTDEVMQAIAEKLPNLRSLYSEDTGNRYFSNQIQDVGFFALIRGCNRLQKLHLISLRQVTSKALSELANCFQLEDLFIEGCMNNLQDEFLDAVTTLVTLKKLKIKGDAVFSEGSFSRLQNLHQLIELSIGVLIELPIGVNIGDHFTNEVLRGIETHCQKLESLTVGSRQWQRVNVEGVSRLLQV